MTELRKRQGVEVKEENGHMRIGSASKQYCLTPIKRVEQNEAIKFEILFVH